MTPELSPEDAKAGACVYILHGLLQRLERTSPGLVEDLLHGASSDHAAIQQSGTMTQPVHQVFEATLKILQRIHAQNQTASATPGH